MGHLSENTRNFGRWVHRVRTNGIGSNYGCIYGYFRLCIRDPKNISVNSGHMANFDVLTPETRVRYSCRRLQGRRRAPKGQKSR